MNSNTKRTASLVMLILSLAALGTMAGCGKSESNSASAKAAKYHCSMHPTYVSDRPGDCPICNMKLTPIKDDDTGGATTNAPALPGRVTIHLAPDKRQLIGLTTSLVETQKLSHGIRASATLSHDETTMAAALRRLGAETSRELHRPARRRG